MPLKKIFLPLFLTSGTIFAFIFYFVKPNLNSPNISSKNNKSSSSTIDDLLSTISSNPNQLQKLSVLPLRCIGCGRCVRIDPSHFEISATTGKSIVISSTNLNSQNLILAINNCPVQAITLS